MTNKVNRIDGQNENKATNYLTNLIVHLKRVADGAIFSTVTTTTFQNTKVVAPPYSILDAFDRTLETHFMQIHSSLGENITPARTREYLLLKLLSGKIELKEAEKRVEASL